MSLLERVPTLLAELAAAKLGQVMHCLTPMHRAWNMKSGDQLLTILFENMFVIDVPHPVMPQQQCLRIEYHGYRVLRLLRYLLFGHVNGGFFGMISEELAAGFVF